MVPKYKAGDVLTYAKYAPKPVLLQIVAVSPEGFKNMYIVKRLGNLGVVFMNFDAIHKNYRLATKTELTLYWG
jgi:hypothetical protein